MKHITTTFRDGGGRNINLYDIPDNCPFCHHAMDPIIHFAYCNINRWDKNDCLQVIYRCPRPNCDSLFITYYRATTGHCDSFIKINSRPTVKKGRDFSDTVKEISPTFYLIYNQALSAEQDDLKEVCGVGYRKAFEFLIKDYLIKNNPEKEEDIKIKFLGKCIEEDIANENVKSMAKRATWLGNDEGHYLRKWEGKDLEDLKKIIDVTIYWIEMEKLTKDTLVEMPENTTTKQG